jgi:hypothetical protein
MKTKLLLLACLLSTGCAQLQSNIDYGINKLASGANLVGQDLTRGGQAVVTAGGDAVTLGTDMIKVGGVIVTNTTPKPAAPAPLSDNGFHPSPYEMSTHQLDFIPSAVQRSGVSTLELRYDPKTGESY